MPDREVLLEIIAQRCREIAHLIERLGTAGMHPVQNLPRAISTFAETRDELLDLVERQIAKVSACERRRSRYLPIRVHGRLL